MTAQPRQLLPELSFATGLPDNVVRVIRYDDQHRLWVGTDKGLMILSNHDMALTQFQKQLGLSLVWTLEFYKEYVLIGTWDNGLFIYNLKHKMLERHFEKDQINRCRNIRIFGDSVFIASRPQGFLLTQAQGKWKLDSLKTRFGSPCYNMDFFEWNGQRYSAQHLPLPNTAFKMKQDSLLENENLPFYQQLNPGAILSAFKNDSNLYLGRAVSYYKISRRNESKDSIRKQIDSQQTHAIWEILMANNRLWMATGNPGTLQGHLIEPGITDIREAFPEFYVQALDSDPFHQGLWFGVSDIGLFYWPLMDYSFHLPIDWQKEATLYLTKNKEVILVKNKSWMPIKLRDGQYLADGPIQTLPLLDDIKKFEKYGDTLIVMTAKELYIRIKEKVYHRTDPENYQNIFKIGHHIYCYDRYASPILDFNALDGTIKRIPLNYTEMRHELYGTNVMLYSEGIGFTFLDTSLKTLNQLFPMVDEHKMLGDTLWTLIGRELRAYLFRPKDTSTQQLLSWNFKNSLPNFVPKWMQTVKNELYLGSQFGYFKIDTRTALPVWYQYTGNFKELTLPKTDGEQLYFHRENYLTAIAPKQPYQRAGLISVKPVFADSLQFLEQEPLELIFKTEDYFLKNHSLKKLELFKDGELQATYFTLDSSFQFKQGLPNGSYSLQISINGEPLKPIIFDVSIPLLKNPAFYSTITLFFLFLISFIAYGWMHQKGLQKRLLESRLQLLKQNLNPHFIFNSLNLIYMLVLLKKNEAAVKTIANFSDLHRYYLENVSKDKVSLQEELSFIRSYLLLESERVHLDTPFTYHLPDQIESNLLNIQLPPMILQPLVENAVKYCQANDGKDAMVWIDLMKQGDKIIIGVENTTAPSKRKISGGSGSGIAMVKERIEINNHTGKSRIALHQKTSGKYINPAYRIELEIWAY